MRAITLFLALITLLTAPAMTLLFWLNTTDNGSGTQFWHGKGVVNAEVGGCRWNLGDWGTKLHGNGMIGWSIGSPCGDMWTTLDRVHIWNHNSQTEGLLGFGIEEARTEASRDGQTGTEVTRP